MTETISPQAKAFKAGELQSLSLDTIKTMAPAAFATSPASYITKRYKFVPTLEVIEHMARLGYVVTNAKQSKTKVTLRENYGTHILEFQNPELFIKNSDNEVEARPTIVFLNSHDGSRPYQFEQGIFRLICANGAIVKQTDLGSFRERHTKLTFEEIKTMISEKSSKLPMLVENINRWSGHEMTEKQRRQFAIDALITRLGEDRQFENYEIFSVLEPRREADKGNSLWHVFNRVQENIIRGGFQVNNRQARAITNPLADMEINQGLWQLAEQYAS